MDRNFQSLEKNVEFSSPVAHTWLRMLNVAFVPGDMTPGMEEVLSNLEGEFKLQGHAIQEKPHGSLDILITTAALHRPVNWRQAFMFNARRHFNLDHHPMVFTIVQIGRRVFEGLMEHFRRATANPEPDPADYDFPGLAQNARFVIHEQGRRAGPIVSILRLLQGQTKCIRILLLVGDMQPEEAYTFDLVGAYPRTPANVPASFNRDLVLRMVTAACTHGITAHLTESERIRAADWASASTPSAMRRAGREFGQRDFFTCMQRVGDLVEVPLFTEVVSRQYSEGCFGTWDPSLRGLVTTITGSARPVIKEDLSDDELAVIVGVKADESGAIVREVDGKRNDPPSTEAVELIGLDLRLPRVNWNTNGEVPVVRSKLHGHRGVRAYDPSQVSFAPLTPAFYYYPVSCSTQAQAQAIMTAFGQAEALLNPLDPRQIVFTILPGHGLVIVEKWVRGKEPFQLIWEAMDNGALQISSHVPQGVLKYIPGDGGLMKIEEAV